MNTKVLADSAEENESTIMRETIGIIVLAPQDQRTISTRRNDLSTLVILSRNIYFLIFDSENFVFIIPTLRFKILQFQ